MITDEMIERVERGEGADEALCVEICLAVQYGGINSAGALNLRTDADWDGDLLYEIEEENDEGQLVLVDCCCPTPKLTASLDAVVSLIEAKLPGCGWQILTHPDEDGGGVFASIAGPKAHQSKFANRSPARALLAATLRALRALQGEPT